jgi:3-dehydroquinate dehydratase/shikimate dehydrogenase
MKSRARICVPVCVTRASELRVAIERAAQVGDIVELRLDCLAADELDQMLRDLPALFTEFDRPMVVTMRSAEQGGRNELSYDERLGFWKSAAKAPGRHLRDLELDLIAELEPGSDLDWDRIICSHHDFIGVPSDLDQIYERMAATESRILKIAVQADDAVDCLPVFDLLERAQREGREMIAIAMGRAGIMTRILGPSRGSYLTYGSIDDESGTAPGQITAKQLREVYRIDNIDWQTEIVGLMGMPVHHSLSPHIHNAAFAAAGIDAVYMPFEVRDAEQFMRRMACPQTRELDWNLHGLSVTAPHKSAVIESLDWIDPTAREIGAVNTIVIQDNQLHGYNTDAAGFLAPLRAKLGSLKGARCAIVGAGGAARAALWGLRTEQAVTTLFVRNPA